MKNIRLAKMEKLILERRIMSLKELQEEFGISMNTIRRDINELIENGNIKKVYGGVEYCESEVEFSDFLERCVRDKDFKELIGRKASRFVEDNDIIFVDSGTTAMNIIYYLCDKKNVTIITNNLSVVIEASRKENINLIALGGEVNKRTFSFAGKDSLNFLKDINITKAFMAATGISVKNGATNSVYEERDIKSKIVDKAEKVFMLVDHTKFDKHSLFTYCELDDIDCIITDKAPEKYKKFAKEHNIKLVECV
ncbi:MAG: DeoR/GlpR family DNA-binding transcription regulator [Peptoanaerobacter stomatis]